MTVYSPPCSLSYYYILNWFICFPVAYTLLYADNLKCCILFKSFFIFFFMSFPCCLLLYYMQLLFKCCILFKNFFYFFSYLLYTSIIYYKFKNDTYFLKIFLCKLSCNLYNGLFSGIIAIKNFLNYPHYVIFVTLHKQGLSFILPFYMVFNTVSCSYCKYTLH